MTKAMTVEELQAAYRRAEVALLSDQECIMRHELGEMNGDEFTHVTMDVNMPAYAPVSDLSIFPGEAPFTESWLINTYNVAYELASILADELNDYDKDSDVEGMAKVAGAVVTLLSWLT